MQVAPIVPINAESQSGKRRIPARDAQKGMDLGKWALQIACS